MPDSYDGIPTELRNLEQWLCWNNVETAPGKWTKVPVNPNNGHAASVTDPSTWGGFALAVAAARAGWVNGGIGFVFTKADPYAGIDLDNPQGDQQRIARYEKIIGAFDSYTEWSPSGSGVHIIARARVENGKRREGVELYSDGRFFTFTGNSYHNPAKPIREEQAKAEILWEELGGGKAAHIGSDWNYAQTESDEVILQRCMNAANGPLFAKLWTGDFSDYPSQSEADQALVNLLCFHSDNREQVSRLFLSSGLGVRDKAKRVDYREATISKGYDQKIALVNTDQLRSTAIAAIERKLAAPVQPANRIIPVSLERPDGLLGEIADFIFAAAPRPVPEIALMGAIGLMCGITGRAYSVNGAGLNQYLLLLAETGRGKEAISAGISKLMNAVTKPMGGATDIGFDAALKFVGPGEIASAPALLKTLMEHSSFVSIIGEFGLKLRKWTGDRANSNDQQIRGQLLDLYGKSGRGNVARQIVYSDKKENTTAIERPALSILGESTATRFLDAIDENMISEGFLPRFLTIEYEGPRPALNEAAHSVVPSIELIGRMRDLCTIALQSMHRNTQTDIQIDPEAYAFMAEFDRFCDGVINSHTQGEVGDQLWTRALLKLYKLAGLYAVGENPFAPVLNIKHARWAKTLVVRDVERMIKRFQSGETGNQATDHKQDREVMRVCAEFFRMDVGKLHKYGVTDAHIQAKQIPYVYINRRLVPTAAFRNDRIGSTNALRRSLNSLCDQGRLREERAQGTLPVADKQAAKHYLLLDMSVLD